MRTWPTTSDASEKCEWVDFEGPSMSQIQIAGYKGKKE